jgi:thiol-disulfide isomerase/thioredoxin
MNKKLSMVLISIILLSGLFSLFACSSAPTNEPANLTKPLTDTRPEVGKPMPDFQAVGLDGTTIVKLSQFVGKPVLINFWATWCTPCMEEMPYMNEIAKTWKDKLVFMSINNGETTTKAQGCIDRYGYTLPVYCDAKGSLALKWNLKYLPMTFLVDQTGKLLVMTPGGYPSAKSIETELLSKVFPELQAKP